MKLRFGGLWRHTDFMKLWIGQTISQFGSQITLFVIPLLAALTLHASAVDMGLLSAAGMLPRLLIGLFAGVWVDRYRRKAVVIIADLGRAILLLLIPVSMVLGVLRIETLYVVTFLVGFLNVFFDVAYTSFLPTLVGRAQLVEGNSKLVATQSTARIVGPSLAGPLVQLLSAPFAILFDVVSFVASAISLLLVHTPEAQSQAKQEQQSMWIAVQTGLKEVVRHPILRAIACSNGTANLFWGVEGAVFMLFLIKEVGTNASLLGVIVASQSVGLFAGTFVASWTARRFGVGRTIVGTPVLSTIAVGIIALAGGPLLLVAAEILCGQFLIGFALIIYHINQMSLQQVLIADQTRGRLNATMSFIGWCVSPLGALVGGVLGTQFGLRPAMVVAALGLWLALPWLICSPLRNVKEHAEAR